MELQKRVEKIEAACIANNMIENPQKYSEYMSIDEKALINEDESDTSSSSSDDIEAFMRNEQEEMEKQLSPDHSLKFTLMSRYSKVNKTNDIFQ